MDKKIIRDLEKINLEVKRDILKICFNAGVGHIGSAFSVVEILTVLYGYVMNINPNKPEDPKRDRFILSKGHAASALYAVLYRYGFFSKKELLTYCKEGSTFGTHPVFDIKEGIEFSTGSLGHGLSVGAGFALAFKMDKSRQKVYVLLSDAELNEGSTWEAVMFSSHHKLDNLVAIIDDNSFQAFGKTDDVLKLHPIANKWIEFGWNVIEVDGHNIEDLVHAFDRICKAGKTLSEDAKPTLIIAKTVVAHGISLLEGKQEAHYKPLNLSQYQKALKEIK